MALQSSAVLGPHQHRMVIPYNSATGLMLTLWEHPPTVWCHPLTRGRVPKLLYPEMMLMVYLLWVQPTQTSNCHRCPERTQHHAIHTTGPTAAWASGGSCSSFPLASSTTVAWSGIFLLALQLADKSDAALVETGSTMLLTPWDGELLLPHSGSSAWASLTCIESSLCFSTMVEMLIHFFMSVSGCTGQTHLSSTRTKNTLVHLSCVSTRRTCSWLFPESLCLIMFMFWLTASAHS